MEWNPVLPFTPFIEEPCSFYITLFCSHTNLQPGSIPSIPLNCPNREVRPSPSIPYTLQHYCCVSCLIPNWKLFLFSQTQAPPFLFVSLSLSGPQFYCLRNELYVYSFYQEQTIIVFSSVTGVVCFGSIFFLTAELINHLCLFCDLLDKAE